MTRNRVWLPPALFFPVVLAACTSCEKDKPYVPYTIDTSASAIAQASVSAMAPPPEEKKIESFSPVLSRRIDAPTATTSGGSITAPGSGKIEWLLEGDMTGNGRPEAMAWVRSKDGSGGELIHYSSTREGAPLVGRVVAPLPADLTLSKGCRATTDLRQVGSRTVAMTFRKTCIEEGIDKVVEWIAAVVPVRDPAVRLSLLIDQPSGGQRLDVGLDALDRDGDRFDDLTLALRLVGTKAFDESASEDVSVGLRYFDRPAGLSRDPDEPSASFSALAQRLTRVAKGAQRGGVGPAARSVRQIHGMLCGESGHSRVRISGASLQCGAAGALIRTSTAELEAYVGAKDVLSAVGALARLQSQGAGTKDIEAAIKRIEEIAPKKKVQAYQLPFSPKFNTDGSSWGPLAFHEDGSLLIRTDSSVMRFDPLQRVALPELESGPMTPWPFPVQSPSGVAFRGAIDPCDGGLLRVRMDRGGDSISEPIPVDSLELRGCSAAPRPIPVRPVLFTDSGLSLLVGNEPIWIESKGSKAKRQSPEQGRSPQGGPRSPDGKYLAHATSLGVLVMDDGKVQIWQADTMADDAKAYERLSACSVAPGAKAVACIDGSFTRVFVGPGV